MHLKMQKTVSTLNLLLDLMINIALMLKDELFNQITCQDVIKKIMR